ncbi:hypothetical protein ACVSMD_00970, partial [Pseudomonas aeruginosa]
RKKSYGGKTDLIRTHESPEEPGCASSLRPHAPALDDRHELYPQRAITNAVRTGSPAFARM